MKSLNISPNPAPAVPGFEFWLVSAEAEYLARLSGAGIAVDFLMPADASPLAAAPARLVVADENLAEEVC